MLLHRALDEHGLGLVLDIVPNHMGIGRANAWWWTCCAVAAPAGMPITSTSTSMPIPTASWSCPSLARRRRDPGAWRAANRAGGRALLAYFDERPLAEGTDPAAGVREILDQQPYRPIYWREGAIRRNYRRFFNIDQLAGLRVDIRRYSKPAMH